MGFLDIFKKKPKSNKTFYAFYMHCGTLKSKLQEVIDQLAESEDYKQAVVRENFVYSLHSAERKIYGEKMIGFFPDAWPAPLYNGNSEVVKKCVIDFVKTEFPEIDTDKIDIRIQIHADGDFASASFAYGEDE